MKIILTVEDGEVNKEFKGKGTQEDPILIDKNSILPDKFELFELKKYVSIKNRNIYYLALYHCENLTIENCQINTLEMFYCKNLEIRKNRIYRAWFNHCNDSTLNDNIFTWELCYFKSHNNNLTRNKFERLFHNPSKLSRGNTLEDNSILDKYKDELEFIEDPIPQNEKHSIYIDWWSGNYSIGESLLNSETGSGNREDPIIIGSLEKYPQHITLRNNRFHIIFESFNPLHLNLQGCKYIVMKDCKLKLLDLWNCRESKFENIEVRNLTFQGKGDIVFEDSRIEKITKKSKKFEGKVSFKNCTIDHLSETLLQKFELIHTKVKESYSNKSIINFISDHQLTFTLLSATSLAFLLILSIFLTMSMIPFYIFIICTIICLVLAGYSDLKEKNSRKKWEEEHKNSTQT